MTQGAQSFRAVAVVGYKKTGKTTLVTRLVTELKQRGLRVGTVKHDAHEFTMDVPDTDTYKHRLAGADAVAIASPGKWALQEWTETPISLQEILSHFHDLDFVIVEGFKQEDLPKVVIMDEAGAIFDNERLTNIVAVAVDEKTAHLAPIGIDVYDKNNIKGICDLLVTRLD